MVNYATTSILAGLRQRAAEIGATVVSGLEGADVVVTCGATTSSEGADRKDLLVDQDADIQRVRQLRHYFGPFIACFSDRHTTTRAVWRALLRVSLPPVSQSPRLPVSQSPSLYFASPC